MTKIWGGIIVLILIIIGAVWLIMAPAPVADTSTETSASTEKRVFTWNITEMSEDPAAPGVPRSSVSLSSGSQTYPVGEFEGSCAEIDGTSWTLVEGEKTGVICWWAGGGSEVGVFEEGSELVIKVGILDEGSAEIPGFRGDFQTIATIE